MGYKEHDVFGADTETVNGDPYTIQLYGKGFERIIYVNRSNVLKKFCSLLDELPSGSLLYFHNLEFDLAVLFNPLLRFFDRSAFTLVGPGLEADILFGNVNTARLRRHGRVYTLYDTFAFFKASLDSLAKLFHFPPKLPKPRGLGKRRFQGAAKRVFEKYALRDAYDAYLLGSEILKLHAMMDVKPCLSAPKLASHVFRHRFFPKEGEIPAVPQQISNDCVLSYHGGKNGLYVSPGVYSNLYLYDIRSAYPYAMTQIPNFLDCSYEYSSRHTGKYQGIVNVSGKVKDSSRARYLCAWTHDYELLQGDFEKVWLTTYEYDICRALGFFESSKVHGAWLVIPSTRAKRNPLKEFAEGFFQKKEEAEGGLREFYKVILNSLYGKFIQTVPVEDEVSFLFDGETLKPAPRSFVAGGLFNPMIASLITGYVRAFLTNYEVAYSSLHSSTDSIITNKPLRTGKALGDWSLQGKGSACLLRPKLFLFWNAKKEIVHAATHGYHGSVPSLIRMLRSGKRTYAHTRMRKVRESLRDGGKPLTFDLFYKKINLPLTGNVRLPTLLWRGKTC